MIVPFVDHHCLNFLSIIKIKMKLKLNIGSKVNWFGMVEIGNINGLGPCF